MFVGSHNLQWHAGTRERDLPSRFLVAFPCFEHPGINVWQFEMARFGQRHLVERLFAAQKSRNGKRGIFAERKIKQRDINSRKIKTVGNSVVTRMVSEERVMLCFELSTAQ